MYGGVCELAVVSQLRKQGLNVRDGQARHRAIAGIWKAVDEDKLRALAIGGRPRQIVRLDPELTKSIPGLRNPRGRGFRALRQPNPNTPCLAPCVGPSLHRTVLALPGAE